VVDRQTLCVTRPWAEYLAALAARAGGAGEQLTNADLAALVTTLTTTVSSLQAQATTRAHLLGGPLTPPSVVPVAAGAGAGATARVVGNDNAGTLTLTTAARAARRSHSEILRLTFAVPYAAPPVVTLMPANDAAWSLYYGRFLRHGHPSSVRLLQAAVSTTGFPLSVGTTALPRAGEVYQFTYHCIGA